MLVTSLPVNAWVQWLKPSDLKGSDFTDVPAFAAALDDVFAGDVDLFTSSSFTKEVSLPLGSRMSMNNAYHMRSVTRNVKTYGWTCFIYSNGAFNRLFGEYVHRGTGLKNCYIAVGKGASKMTYDLLANANIKTGAYIRTSPKSDGSYYGNDGHSMIILAYDEKYITYLEGNGDGKGLVRVTKRTYSEFNSAQLTGRGRKITHIVQPTDEWFNELYGNSPEENTYTVSYDANGGFGNMDSCTVPYNGEISLASNGFDRNGHILSGWALKRDYDNAWLTENGWVKEESLGELSPTTFATDGTIPLDASLIKDTYGNVAFTAYAVWADSPRLELASVTVIDDSFKREFYPIGSQGSLSGAQLEFTFTTGDKVRVTVNDSCNNTLPQSFRLKGNDYSFYIDSDIKAEGDNPCYVRIENFKATVISLYGGKSVKSARIVSSPSVSTGENAEVELTYSDGTTETIVATEFIPNESQSEAIGGLMKTNGGFAISWTYSAKVTDDTVTVTFPCGFTKTAENGDFNMDGHFDTTDLASIKLLLSFLNDDQYNAYCAADFNGDGELSTVDLAALKLTLAGVY